MAETGELVQKLAVRTAIPSSSDSPKLNTAQHDARPHPPPSSQGSSPTPSNPSHPSSPHGDDARHGTSPATSVDGMSLPSSGLKLDLSSHIAQSRHEQQASLSRAGVARSPHPLDGSQEARASLAARSGGILATMQEEGSSFSDSRRGSTLGFDPNHSYSHMEQAIRASRHRSASSAAALALHGGAAPFVDRWASNAAGRIAPASGASSRSLWEGANVDSMAGRDAHSGASQKPFPPLQRGFSASVIRSKPEPASPTPFLSSPAGFRDLGFDFSEPSVRTSRAGLHAASSPFGLGPDLPELSSYPESTDQFGDDMQRPSAGTESRRHSVAGSGLTRDSAGVIGGHRRAIGFDTTSNGNRDYSGQLSHDQRAWPRAVSHGRDRSVSSVLPGFNPFAGGSLALSMDDLAGDHDFEPTSQSGLQRPDATYLTTDNADNAGGQAASMPSNLYERGAESFDPRFAGFNDASHARGNRGGRESLSVSWDTMTPSQTVARSPGDGQQRTLAEMTRQLRQMSMGGGDPPTLPNPSGIPSIFDSQAEGTRTVRASPGTSPVGVRGGPHSSSSTLSAQAKSFTASQSLTRITQDQFGAAGYASMGPRDVPMYGYPAPAAAPGSGLMPQMASVPPFVSAQHHLNAGASAVGFPGPSLGLPSPASANDLTFSSLAALGPMPPSSMAPPGFMGAAGGPALSAGTTSELQELGKGVPLTSLSQDTPLYIVEFKQGRTDLFFRSKSPSQSPSNREQEPIRRGDLVIVEADRGKDLGTVVNDSITVEQVQAFLAHQSDLTIGTAASGAAGAHGSAALLTGAGGSSNETSPKPSGLSGSPSSTMNAALTSGSASGTGARPMRTISPKRLFTKATAADTSSLYAKAQDEERALQLCVTKVMQRGLPMSVVAAEMQWDRRKLTFYYTASMRVDFRDLVKELFRLYKTRIWMCHLGHPSGAGMG